jgi:hypothetical protein
MLCVRWPCSFAVGPAADLSPSAVPAGVLGSPFSVDLGSVASPRPGLARPKRPLLARLKPRTLVSLLGLLQFFMGGYCGGLAIFFATRWAGGGGRGEQGRKADMGSLWPAVSCGGISGGGGRGGGGVGRERAVLRSPLGVPASGHRCSPHTRRALGRRTTH